MQKSHVTALQLLSKVTVFLIQLVIRQVCLVVESITFILDIQKILKKIPVKKAEPVKQNRSLKPHGSINCLKITDQSIKFPLEQSILIITDIIDSTKLYNENPLKMQFFVESHKKIVKALIKRHLGHVVANEGDSFRLVFQHFDNAIRFAHEFIAKHNEEISYFKVRMVMNKGLLCVRNLCGFKVFGKPVNDALELFKHNSGNQVCIKKNVVVKYNLKNDDILCIH